MGNIEGTFGKVNIGSGANLIVIRNSAGGYNVLLESNMSKESSYILIAHTTKLIDRENIKVWE